VVTIVFCLRRLPTITAQEFSDYWYSRHSALFRQYAATLGVRRYVQLHRVSTPLNEALRSTRQAADGYDGVAQVWFDSMDELLAGLGGPAGRAAGEQLIADERAFIDHARSAIWISDEREIEL
jgi:uncharacterized protein (TIGR02118 family)